MNFELGKEYIVRVNEKGIIPIDEFDRARFFDKDYDSLDFLTDEEKQIIIKSTLKELKHEIRKKIRSDSFNESIVSYNDISKIFDKYMTNIEE